MRAAARPGRPGCSRHSRHSERSWPGRLTGIARAATSRWEQRRCRTSSSWPRASFPAGCRRISYHQTLTWMAADVSAHPRFNGDLAAALGAIKARALIMPCDTDMYFAVADNAAEVAQMRKCGTQGHPFDVGARDVYSRHQPEGRRIRRCRGEAAARLPRMRRRHPLCVTLGELSNTSFAQVCERLNQIIQVG